MELSIKYLFWRQKLFTKLEDRTKLKNEVIRQEDCQCACNSVIPDPDGHDGTIVARNFSTNQIQVDTSFGGDKKE